jgi:hypothetical protein
MKRCIPTVLLLSCLMVLSCSIGNPTNSLHDSLEGFLKDLCNASKHVYMQDLDLLIHADSTAKGDFPYDQVGKWVFCDYYSDTIDEITTDPIVASTLSSNDWGEGIWDRPAEQNKVSENGFIVTGYDDDTIPIIFLISDAADPYTNKYHVYQSLPYQDDGIHGKNVWFGNGHVFYFNPVDGNVAAGEPYLEIFPDIVTDEILELRYQETSYYQYNGIHAGGCPEDLGSTMEEMIAAFGMPVQTITKPQREDSDWDSRNILFLYTNGETYARQGYIHYANDEISIRIFLTWFGTSDTLNVTAMYFRKIGT